MTDDNDTDPLERRQLAGRIKPKRKYTRRDAEIVIEHGIPIPPPVHKAKYPWDVLDVNDSFFVREPPGSLQSSVYKRSKEGPKEFTARAVTVRGVKGLRVWRTK
jgi:hypothetical protein